MLLFMVLVVITMYHILCNDLSSFIMLFVMSDDLFPSTNIILEIQVSLGIRYHLKKNFGMYHFLGCVHTLGLYYDLNVICFLHMLKIVYIFRRYTNDCGYIASVNIWVILWSQP